MDLKMKYDIRHQEVINGITYRVAKSKDDVEKVTDFFLDYFLPGEPGTQILGGHTVGRHPSLVKQVNDLLIDGVSLMAIDKKTGECVGIMASITYDRDTTGDRPSLEELQSEFPHVHAHLMDAADTVCWAKDMFELHPEVERIYYLFYLGVRPDYRQRGMAMELVNQAYKVARLSGCQAAMVVATNIYTRRIFDKIGMDTVKELYWKDVIVDGKPVCPETNLQKLTSHYQAL